jgi:hypothetical protein
VRNAHDSADDLRCDQCRRLRHIGTTGKSAAIDDIMSSEEQMLALQSFRDAPSRQNSEAILR